MTRSPRPPQPPQFPRAVVLGLSTALFVACTPRGAAPTTRPRARESGLRGGKDVASFALSASTRWVLVGKSRGVQLLTRRDAFIAAMSPFDRQARLRASRPVDEQTFLRHVGSQVLDWQPRQIEAVRRSAARLPSGSVATASGSKLTR